MIPYVVRAGDYLTGIASERGFDPREVWNDPKNAVLRELRPNPEVLAAGDILYVPGEPAERLPVTAGSKNKFTATLPTITVRLTLTGLDGKPLAGAKYWVDGVEAGSTDGQGKVAIEVLPTQRSIALRVEGSPHTYRLRIANLDPVETESGVRQRLHNLHYLPENTPHLGEERVAEALRRFQEQHGLEATGELDKPTRDMLVSEHGS